MTPCLLAAPAAGRDTDVGRQAGGQCAVWRRLKARLALAQSVSLPEDGRVITFGVLTEDLCK